MKLPLVKRSTHEALIDKKLKSDLEKDLKIQSLGDQIRVSVKAWQEERQYKEDELSAILAEMEKREREHSLEMLIMGEQLAHFKEKFSETAEERNLAIADRTRYQKRAESAVSSLRRIVLVLGGTLCE